MEITKETKSLKEIMEPNKEEQIRAAVEFNFRPASLLDIPLKYRDSNFTYYWASKNGGRLEKKLAEGWEVDRHLAPAMRKDGLLPNFSPTLQDGQQMGNTLERREMIVVRAPNGLIESRRRYYQNKSDVLLGAKTNGSDSELGQRAYGDGLKKE